MFSWKFSQPTNVSILKETLTWLYAVFSAQLFAWTWHPGNSEAWFKEKHSYYVLFGENREKAIWSGKFYFCTCHNGSERTGVYWIQLKYIEEKIQKHMNHEGLENRTGKKQEWATIKTIKYYNTGTSLHWEHDWEMKQRNKAHSN